MLWGPKKPRNYKGWLTYVNLIAARLAILVYYLPNANNLDIITACEGPHHLFDLAFILHVYNKFRANKHG